MQAHYEASERAALFGWKIAATSIAGQQHIHVDGPLAGRIVAERVVPAGGSFTLAGNQMLVCEGEFAFRMGRDLTARCALTPAEVKDAVDDPASRHRSAQLALPPFRGKPAPRNSSPTTPAPNNFMLGEAAPDTWRSLDLVRHIDPWHRRPRRRARRHRLQRAGRSAGRAGVDRQRTLVAGHHAQDRAGGDHRDVLQALRGGAGDR